MVLRYDDPFWATGTPPNGWGCQCYRNQLTESQAKASGVKVGVPQDIDTNNLISPEWRYDPGREMLAPNFTRYTALRRLKHKGKSALSQIMNTYQEEISGYQLNQSEWNIYVSNLPDESLPNKRLFADAPMMFGTLRQDAADAIGEDVKLVIRDRSVIHGARTRRAADGSPADVNLSLDDLKQLPRRVADPDSIFKDNSTGSLIFSYKIDRENDAKIVFIPARNLTSMVLHTFFKVAQKSIDKDMRYTKIYDRR